MAMGGAAPLIDIVLNTSSSATKCTRATTNDSRVAPARQTEGEVCGPAVLQHGHPAVVIKHRRSNAVLLSPHSHLLVRQQEAHCGIGNQLLVAEYKGAHTLCAGVSVH